MSIIADFATSHGFIVEGLFKQAGNSVIADAHNPDVKEVNFAPG